jgi:rRNA pseudouridine-1189 N-methylase Emg1 (Nep1/Mra1 family)
MVGGLEPPPEEEEQRREIEATQGVIFVLEGANLETAQVGKVIVNRLRGRRSPPVHSPPRAVSPRRLLPLLCCFRGSRRRRRRRPLPTLPSPQHSNAHQQSYQLLNCDDHATYLKKHKKDPAFYRPDIAHQALLMILDSPLNKAGKLKVRREWRSGGGRSGAAPSAHQSMGGGAAARRLPARSEVEGPASGQPNQKRTLLLTLLQITPPSCFLSTTTAKALYVHTSKNILIQINPKVRLPRTFKRFCGLMVQLLQKLSIRATNGPDKLMRVSEGGGADAGGRLGASG